MILIISENDDFSTSEVIDWLIYFKQEYIRINFDDNIETVEVNLPSKNDIIFKIKGKEYVSINEIKSFWYRRGNISIVFPKLDTFENSEFLRNSIMHLKEDINTLRDYIYFQLEKKKRIGSFFNRDVNKLVVLDIAHQCGLNIPETLISTNKKSIEHFIKTYKHTITKGIQITPTIHTNNNHYAIYTEELSQKNMNNVQNKIFPSQVQEKIRKQFELRIFYLNKKFYTGAIFSQNNSKTKIDFRKYDLSNPNRIVPYNLPENIQKKLIRLMDELKLNTGSIDMLVDKNDNHIFLEVNPVGQFGMISYPCNFFLEREIANFLSNK